MCGTAKIDPLKLNCKIAFVACQQMECMRGFLSLRNDPPPRTHTLCPAHFTSVTPAFPFHSSKMHEYILNGRCRECGSYLQRWHLTKMAFYLCAIIDGFACFMRVRATLCWIFYQGGFSGHEKCLTGHLRCTNNLFWCKSQVAGLGVADTLSADTIHGVIFVLLIIFSSSLYLHIFYYMLQCNQNLIKDAWHQCKCVELRSIYLPFMMLQGMIYESMYVSCC